jgi:hypothetical protein
MGMHVPAQLVEALAPWQAYYADSKPLSTATTFVHLAAMLFGGGTALAADRATLRASRGDAEHRWRVLDDLHRSHRTVLIALTFSLISGLALVAADIETFAASPLFLVKLVVLTLLVGNGGLLTVTESRLRRIAPDAREGGPHVTRLWRRLRLTAVTSLFLWTATVLAGTALANA